MAAIFTAEPHKNSGRVYVGVNTPELSLGFSIDQEEAIQLKEVLENATR